MAVSAFLGAAFGTFACFKIAGNSAMSKVGFLLDYERKERETLSFFGAEKVPGPGHMGIMLYIPKDLENRRAMQIQCPPRAYIGDGICIILREK